MHYNVHYEYLYNALYIKALSELLPKIIMIPKFWTVVYMNAKASNYPSSISYVVTTVFAYFTAIFLNYCSSSNVNRIHLLPKKNAYDSRTFVFRFFLSPSAYFWKLKQSCFDHISDKIEKMIIKNQDKAVLLLKYFSQYSIKYVFGPKRFICISARHWEAWLLSSC